MTLHIKESGSWRTVDQPFVNVSGTWKTVKEVHIKHGGSWRLSHRTPYTEYTLGDYVLDQNIGEDETGTYTIPTGQGIAYIQIYVEGQAGGGGGGTYTPSYWPCSGSDVNFSQTSNVYMGGYGGLGGGITCIHRVQDGDYVTWQGYSDGPANGGGGTGYNLNVYPMSSGTGYPSPGGYSAGSGDNGFMTACNIRWADGTSKAQLWAGGGTGGPGSTITLNSTCTGSGGGFAGFRGFNVSGVNGEYGDDGGQERNEIVVGSSAISVVESNGTLARGVGGNVGYTVTNSGNGASAQNIGQVKIKLYTPDKY